MEVIGVIGLLYAKDFPRMAALAVGGERLNPKGRLE